MNVKGSEYSVSFQMMQRYTSMNQEQAHHNERSATRANSSQKDRVSISIEARKLADLTEKGAQLNLSSSDPLFQYRYGDVSANKEKSFMERIIQASIDKRTGVDREKLEEINQKITAIIQDPTIAPEEKQELITMLAKEREKIFEQAAKKTAQQAKIERVENQTSNDSITGEW